MTTKPSHNEDEYFARRDAEILKARREAAERAARDAVRRSHFMKCPKCGADLKTEEWSGIQVDRCHECLGVWFDAGEAEELIKHEAKGGGLASVFTALVRGVRGSGPAARPHEPTS
ncbi:MAG TPA: zf-TFIIB domain-containing protein [Gemmatimonadales bacterium]|nr:zf-TFIIB domain-containing protein [Gemmatimonadales bacterium]